MRYTFNRNGQLTEAWDKELEREFLAKGGLGNRLRLYQDWHERHRMLLRVSFEPQVRSPKASYDIQYGYLEQATHCNTSWEMERFEVMGQRYADLSNHDYGFALLNDCKYGHCIEENRMNLNLLRSSTLPDPDTDQSRIVGLHEFTYAILPHKGNLQKTMPGLQAEAALLNHGPLCFVGVDLSGIDLPIGDRERERYTGSFEEGREI